MGYDAEGCAGCFRLWLPKARAEDWSPTAIVPGEAVPDLHLPGPDLLGTDCTDQTSPHLDVKAILAEHHGAHVCTLCDGVKIVLVLGIIALVIYFINSQERALVALASWIEQQGWWGRLLFFVFFLWVGVPIGYGWSTVVVLTGFAYGWLGAIDTAVGTMLSAVLNYWAGRYLFAGWLNRKVSSMSDKRRLYIMAAMSVMQNPRAGCLMQVVLRFQPIPFGLANGIISALCSVPLWSYCLATAIGMTPTAALMLNLGIVVRDLGSLEAAASTPSGRANLAVQITILVVSVVASFLFGRYLSIHVLPRMLDQEKRGDREESKW